MCYTVSEARNATKENAGAGHVQNQKASFVSSKKAQKK